MYLKSIEVQGFKSFANKIKFDFHNGITGIVGPNGSGKSNVADAVRWVLGEQRVKQLRGGTMQDVIFSGTENRKPLSYASVAITLDNSDHKLPVEFEEVTVTRKLYRSGESEYMINGAACRLKDINEMFYDTGIGKEGYSIIGQGQIDKILSGKPEERRELFDEAAGIVKFKRRKNLSLKKLEEEIDCYHLILLSDYLKGLLTYDFTQGVIHLAKEHGIPVIIDVKDPHVEKYKGAYLLKPNLKEIRELTGMPAQTDQEIIEAAETLRERCECEYVLCTCGARGMVLVGKNHEPFFIGSQVREVYDVSGAGDTTISYLAAGMANGIDMDDAVTIANVAAGIQVGKTGTSSVYMREVRDFLANEDEGTFHKILYGADLETFRQDNADKKIVFTNGCFDILHVGHKRYLQQAATLGDILVVGVNSDDSVKRLKGPERPINSEQDRTEMLCAMKFVDYVVIFEEDTPYELIKKIQPDVLVKGGDYKPEEVVGRDIVEARGGRLELIKFVDGKSTTNIINKINHK